MFLSRMQVSNLNLNSFFFKTFIKLGRLVELIVSEKALRAV